LQADFDRNFLLPDNANEKLIPAGNIEEAAASEGGEERENQSGDPASGEKRLAGVHHVAAGNFGREGD